MQIDPILDDPKNSFLIVTPGESTDVVIAVPHHAPLGITKLQCNRESDENAGFLGYYLSRLLNCYSVIACNYFLDANKYTDTDYYKKIADLKPKMLVEIHGHGNKNAHFDIEISSGREDRNFWSKEMEIRLQAILSNVPSLRGYNLSGDFEKIYFRATDSKTINTNKWVAFHIELPKLIRQSKSQYILFCELLAETIKSLLEDFDKISESHLQNTV